jgi:hypothetical protein
VLNLIILKILKCKQELLLHNLIDVKKKLMMQSIFNIMELNLRKIDLDNKKIKNHLNKKYWRFRNMRV